MTFNTKELIALLLWSLLVHVGRASLAAVAAAGDTSHPLHACATEHDEPQFGGIDGARERHALILEAFRQDVGPDLDLVAALRG